MIKLRLLYLPFEKQENDQVGPRKAFEGLLKEGKLEDYLAYSFYYQSKQLGSWDLMLDELFGIVRKYQPTAIYWHLQTSGVVPVSFIRKIKEIDSRPVICQSTGDSYWSPPKSMVSLGREIDVTFLSGTGMAPKFEKAGCKNVRLLPEPFDPSRFGRQWNPGTSRDFDVVMITNRIWSRNPFRIMDGQKERVKLIKGLEKRFGKRFGLFGNGWSNITKCWQGPVPYESQEDILHSAWASIATNNWNKIAHYFSDRQFISMGSGVPHVCRYIPKIDDFFEEGKHCFFYQTVEEAVRKCEVVLDNPVYYQETMGKCARELVFAKHTAKHRAMQIIETLEEARICRDKKVPMSPAKYNFFLEHKI